MSVLQLVVFAATAFSLLSANAQNVSGVFMVVKGDVKVTYSATKQTEAARIGRKVGQGDVIVSGPDSRAKIIMEDKNVLNIAPDSKVIIERYTNDGKDSRNVDLKVEYGKVRASVEQKYDGQKNTFNVKTPTAVAGVRGTDFITSHSRATNKTTIVTFHGAVQLGSIGASGKIEGAILVSAGMTAEKAPGQAPEPPKPMPSEEMQRMDTESDAAKAPDVAAGPSTGGGEQAGANKEEPKQESKEAPAAESSVAAKEEPKKEANAPTQENQPKNDGNASALAEATNQKPPEQAPSANNASGNEKAPSQGASSANPNQSGSRTDTAAAPPASGAPGSNTSANPAAAAPNSNNPGSAPAPATGATPPAPPSANNPPAASAPASRAPSSVGPSIGAPSMINARDLSPDMSRDIRGNMGPQIRPVILPPPPVVPRPPANNVIDEARRSGPTRVNIIPK